MIYFLKFPLIRPNMNGTSDTEGGGGRTQDCSPCGAVTWSQWPRDVSPSEAEKWNFQTQFPQFGAYLLPTSLTENLLFISNKKKIYICYFHIYPSHLSCFDAFVRILKKIYLWLLKRKRGVWGGCPPQKSKKKCNFHIQFAKFGAYLLATFY